MTVAPEFAALLAKYHAAKAKSPELMKALNQAGRIGRRAAQATGRGSLG